MTEAVQMYEMNLYRALSAMGSASMIENPVTEVWVTPTRVYHRKPQPGKYESGSQRRGHKLYDTEAQAWKALIEEFDAWAKTKREAIVTKACKALGMDTALGSNPSQ